MNKIIENNLNESNNNIINVVKGCAVAFIITFILLFIFAAILTYTSISENTIAPVIIIITAISILIGSQISSLKIKKNGIINGGIVGFIYISLLYLISSLVGNMFAVNMYSMVMILCSIIFGMLGGIIGVNRK